MTHVTRGYPEKKAGQDAVVDFVILRYPKSLSNTKQKSDFVLKTTIISRCFFFQCLVPSKN